jgi:hypothetical protein
MRKQLLATTALVAAGVMAASAPASAQKKGNTVKLGLKGYMEQIVGIAFDRPKIEDISTSQTGGRGTLDVDTESEIHFKGSGKLDNGISILADVQLEVTGSPGNVIDEQYMVIRGNFGQVNLGSEDNAGHLMTIGYIGSWATGVGQNLTFDSADWIPLPTGVSPGARFDGTLNPELLAVDQRGQHHGGVQERRLPRRLVRGRQLRPALRSGPRRGCRWLPYGQVAGHHWGRHEHAVAERRRHGGLRHRRTGRFRRLPGRHRVEAPRGCARFHHRDLHLDLEQVAGR